MKRSSAARVRTPRPGLSGRLPQRASGAAPATVAVHPQYDAALHAYESGQYAVAAALVGRAIRAAETPDAVTITGRILDYAGRFPQREMGVMLVSDLHRAIGESLFQVPAFATWANAIADVMLYE